MDRGGGGGPRLSGPGELGGGPGGGPGGMGGPALRLAGARVQYTPERRQQILHHQQQRLVGLWHASKCQHVDGQCPRGDANCMRELWKHIAACREKRCRYMHCVSSLYVVSHYHHRKDEQCSVCGPLRDVIRSSRSPQQVMSAAAATASVAAAGATVAAATGPRAAPAMPRPPPLEEYVEMHLPKSLACPISLQLLDDPVVLAADGCTYSRGAIDQHLAFCRDHSRPLTSPLTNLQIDPAQAVLVPNVMARGFVLGYWESKAREWRTAEERWRLGRQGEEGPQ